MRRTSRNACDLALVKVLDSILAVVLCFQSFIFAIAVRLDAMRAEGQAVSRAVVCNEIWNKGRQSVANVADSGCSNQIGTCLIRGACWPARALALRY